MNFLRGALGSNVSQVTAAAKSVADKSVAASLAVHDHLEGLGAVTAKARVAEAAKRIAPRTLLFVPGSNKRAIEKAATLPVDAIIIDLEDGVAPDQKFKARDQVVDALRDERLALRKGRKVVVRVNSPRAAPGWGMADLDMCGAVFDKLDAIAIPKIEPGDAQLVEEYLHENSKLWAFIETPKGILHANEICASGRFEAVAIGCNDLSAELKLPLMMPPGGGVSRRFGLFASMSQAVLAARAHNMPVFDGVFNDLNDAAGFQAECLEGRLMGFDGKTLIHPSQIKAAREAFTPSAAEVAWARRVLQEVDENPEAIGAIAVEGKLVEELHMRRAAEIVALIESTESSEADLGERNAAADESKRMTRQPTKPRRQGAREFDYLKNERWEGDDVKLRMPP